MSAPRILHVLTGEYPPDVGGVADYTAQVASGLVSVGLDVHVWTSAGEEPQQAEGVTVHRAAGRWSAADLDRLGRALDGFPAPRRLLVQYTPFAWGYRGLNLGFARWLVGRRHDRGDEVRVMFHEVAYPWQAFDRPTRWVLASGQRLMAHTVLAAADHVDVSTPAWTRLLRTRRPVGWRPVPSNIPVDGDPEAVAAVLARVAPGGERVVGSFGSFSALVGPLLAGALPRLLTEGPGCVGLLIGHGGDAFAARLVARHPALAGRLVATGGLDARGVSTHLAASDVLVQPYPDGVTTRRTTVMAALAHGVPVVTNAGHLTEPLWADSVAVALAPTPDPVALAAEAGRLVNDPGEWARLGAAGRALYDARFSLARTVDALAGAWS